MICPHCLFEHLEEGPRCGACGRRLAETPAPQAAFVGRSRELGILEAQLAEVRRTRAPRLIGVVGLPRVGKSRLMAELAARHAADYDELRVLRGFPAPGGRAIEPFAPFARLVHVALGLDERASLVVRREQARSALAALAPPALGDALRGLSLILGLHLGESADRAAGEWSEDESRRTLDRVMARQQAFAAFAWLLTRLSAQAPLLVLLEGVSRATGDGLALLAYLRAHLEQGPILLLCEGEQPGAITLSSRLVHGLLPVPRLSPDEIGALLMGVTGRLTSPPHNLVALVDEVSSGLPELVLQAGGALLHHGLGTPNSWGIDPDGPLRLSFALTDAQAASLRLQSLSQEERVWLRRAAVVGPVFWEGALIPVARVELGSPVVLSSWVEQPEPGVVGAALTQAARAGLVLSRDTSLVAGTREYAFTRPAEHALLAAEVGPEEAMAMHAVVAQWLEAKAGDEEHLLSDIAAHYAAGQNEKRAAYFFILAGDRARRRYASEVAVEAFERALSLLDERDALPLMDVYHALGVLHAEGGRPDRAEAAFERMLAAAWLLDHRAKAGAALNRLGRLARDRGQYAQAIQWLERGHQAFEESGDVAGVAASIDDLGQVLLLQGELARAMELFEEVLTFRRAAGNEAGVALSLTNLGRLGIACGDLARAAGWLSEALAVRERLEDLPGALDSRLALAELLLVDGRVLEATAEAAKALELARRTGQVSRLLKAQVLSALVCGVKGAREPALRFALEAEALSDQLGDERSRIRIHRARALLEREFNPQAAFASISEAIRLARRLSDRAELAQGLLLEVELRVRLSTLDMEKALSWAEAELDGTREPAPQEGPSGGGLPELDSWIDEALGSVEAQVPPWVSALAPGDRAHLEAAVLSGHEAIALFDALKDARLGAAVRLRLVPLVLALGDSARARRLKAELAGGLLGRGGFA